MRNGAKSTKCLELQANTPQTDPDQQQSDPFEESPFKKYFEPILNTQVIGELSRESLGLDNMVLSKCLPDLKKIAKTHNLNLNNPTDWKDAVSILKNPKR